jgi:hypothetical protein
MRLWLSGSLTNSESIRRQTRHEVIPIVLTRWEMTGSRDKILDAPLD